MGPPRRSSSREFGSSPRLVEITSLTLARIYQTGHLTLEANTTIALESYTKASEGWGSPEAQYKLGFLYASNFGSAFDGVEGTGQQGSVSVKGSSH